jgi:hypothetical protein
MNAFAKVLPETKAQIAIQLVIMDAINKGHTEQGQILEYMKSEIFENAVKRYMKLMDDN